jgi:hypothetical protein
MTLCEYWPLGREAHGVERHSVRGGEPVRIRRVGFWLKRREGR